MNDHKYYIVYRVYTDEEMVKRIRSTGNNRIYGWTYDKRVLEAFMMQRDKKKYISYKVSRSKIEKTFGSSSLPPNTMINYLPLISAKSGEEIPIFMTMDESQECEKKIQRYFDEMSSLSNIPFKNKEKEIDFYVSMFVNIKEKYASAIHYLGFRPPEVDAKFDSMIDAYDAGDVYDMIDQAYEKGYPMEYHGALKDGVPGRALIDDPVRKSVYSFESFIKVLREDL